MDLCDYLGFALAYFFASAAFGVFVGRLISAHNQRAADDRWEQFSKSGDPRLSDLLNTVPRHGGTNVE